MDITNPDMVEVINKKIDHIMFAGRIDYVEDNWDAVKDLDVTCSFRLIGQTNEHAEGVIRPYVEEGLKLIHYSPEERFTRFPNLPYTEIRFYKNPDEFNDWSGHLASIMLSDTNPFFPVSIKNGISLVSHVRPKLQTGIPVIHASIKFKV